MTTLQRGIGSADGTALVAEGGKLVRVSLADFSIVARSSGETSLDHDDSCRGVPFGGGIGFVCGGEGNGTSIHVVDSHLETREIAQREEGRIIIHGENGQFREERSYGTDPFPPKG